MGTAARYWLFRNTFSDCGPNLRINHTHDLRKMDLTAAGYSTCILRESEPSIFNQPENSRHNRSGRSPTVPAGFSSTVVRPTAWTSNLKGNHHDCVY